MAELATQMMSSPRNVDTLGWAHYIEGSIERSLQLLSESLQNHDATTQLDSWTSVAYHNLYVLLSVGDDTAPAALLADMIRIAPGRYWTQHARNLAVQRKVSSSDRWGWIDNSCQEKGLDFWQEQEHGRSSDSQGGAGVAAVSG